MNVCGVEERQSDKDLASLGQLLKCRQTIKSWFHLSLFVVKVKWFPKALKSTHKSDGQWVHEC